MLHLSFFFPLEKVVHNMLHGPYFSSRYSSPKKEEESLRIKNVECETSVGEKKEKKNVEKMWNEKSNL